MNIRFVIVAACACALCLLGCRREDISDDGFKIEVPALTQNDMPKVVAALGKFAGVQTHTIRFDAATHTVFLKYDSLQVAKKNLEFAIAELGFTANGVTPESVGAK